MLLCFAGMFSIQNITRQTSSPQPIPLQLPQLSAANKKQKYKVVFSFKIMSSTFACWNSTDKSNFGGHCYLFYSLDPAILTSIKIRIGIGEEKETLEASLKMICV